MVQYELDTGTQQLGKKFGTTSIPIPATSVRVYRGYLPYQRGSVHPQYSSHPSGMVRYEFDTGTRHFGKFGTTPIPVPDTLFFLSSGGWVNIKLKLPHLRCIEYMCQFNATLPLLQQLALRLPGA